MQALRDTYHVVNFSHIYVWVTHAQVSGLVRLRTGTLAAVTDTDLCRDGCGKPWSSLRIDHKHDIRVARM